MSTPSTPGSSDAPNAPNPSDIFVELMKEWLNSTPEEKEKLKDDFEAKKREFAIWYLEEIKKAGLDLTKTKTPEPILKVLFEYFGIPIQHESATSFEVSTSPESSILTPRSLDTSGGSPEVSMDSGILSFPSRTSSVAPTPPTPVVVNLTLSPEPSEPSDCIRTTPESKSSRISSFNYPFPSPPVLIYPPIYPPVPLHLQNPLIVPGYQFGPLPRVHQALFDSNFMVLGPMAPRFPSPPAPRIP